MTRADVASSRDYTIITMLPPGSKSGRSVSSVLLSALWAGEGSVINNSPFIGCGEVQWLGAPLPIPGPEPGQDAALSASIGERINCSDTKRPCELGTSWQLGLACVCVTSGASLPPAPRTGTRVLGTETGFNLPRHRWRCRHSVFLHCSPNQTLTEQLYSSAAIGVKLSSSDAIMQNLVIFALF